MANTTKGESMKRLESPASSLAVRLVLGVLCVLMLGACSSGPSRVAPVESSPAQLDFGVDMARRGLWSEALFRFKQAERLDPGDPQILNNMAVAYEALGQFDRALDYYQRAIKADRSNRELRRNYSRFVEFYRAFRPDEVVEDSGGTEVAEGGT